LAYQRFAPLGHLWLLWLEIPKDFGDITHSSRHFVEESLHTVPQYGIVYDPTNDHLQSLWDLDFCNQLKYS
jgi:hypothetical protein